MSTEPTPGYLVWRLSMKWRVAVDRAVAPLGLTHAQYVLLASLYGMEREGRRPTQRELADHLGLDESTIAVALAIAKLPENVMHEMVARPDRFGSNMAYQVSRFHTARGADATLRLINKIASDDLSTRQVADIVKGRASAQESPKPAGRQRYAQRLEIKLEGLAVGDLKTYGDDRIELRLRGLSKDKRDEILQQIEKILQADTVKQ